MPLLRRPWPTSCIGQMHGVVQGQLGKGVGMCGVCVVPEKQPENGRLGLATLAWHHHEQSFLSAPRTYLNSLIYAPQPTDKAMTGPPLAAVGMASRVPPQVLLKTALDYVARRGTS